MTGPALDDLDERAAALRGVEAPGRLLARALLACDIEFDRAAREQEWKRAADIAYLTRALTR